jgi:hypothetical protein
MNTIINLAAIWICADMIFLWFWWKFAEVRDD